MLTEVFLIGAGGHAKVVCAALYLQHPEIRPRMLDDDPKLHETTFLDLRIEAPPAGWERLPAAVHICVGNNATRRSIAERMQKTEKKLFTIVHPSAVVSRYAMLAEGVFAAANTTIGPEATIGAGVIINHGVVVDHDCNIGAFAHIAPNATLGGGVRVGSGALIGSGAVLLPGLEVGAGAIVGAGAVVIRSVAPGVTVYGVPARLQ